MTISVTRSCSGPSSPCWEVTARASREVQRALARIPLDSLRPMDRPYFGLAYISGLVGKADRALRAGDRVPTGDRSTLSGSGTERPGARRGSHRSGRAALARRHCELVEGPGRTVPRRMVGRSWRERTMFSEKPISRSLYERYVASPDGARSTTGCAAELPRTYLRLGELYAAARGPEEGRRGVRPFHRALEGLRPRTATPSDGSPPPLSRALHEG